MSELNGLQSESLLGVRYDIVDHQGLLSAIESAVAEKRPYDVMNVNVHAMNLAYRDKELQQIFREADLVFVDGAGAKLGALLHGKNVGQRLTMDDWMDDLFILCSKNRWSVFLLGDEEKYGESFKAALASRYPDIPFAGYHHGFFDKHGKENEHVISMINASNADVVLVGMSMPIQERWMAANKMQLNPSVRIASGAYHRVFSKDIARGPKWMTDNGFEWLYRLMMQPHTWRRYLLGNPLFVFRVLCSKLIWKK